LLRRNGPGDGGWYYWPTVYCQCCVLQATSMPTRRVYSLSTVTQCHTRGITPSSTTPSDITRCHTWSSSWQHVTLTPALTTTTHNSAINSPPPSTKVATLSRLLLRYRVAQNTSATPPLRRQSAALNVSTDLHDVLADFNASTRCAEIHATLSLKAPVPESLIHNCAIICRYLQRPIKRLARLSPVGATFLTRWTKIKSINVFWTKQHSSLPEIMQTDSGVLRMWAVFSVSWATVYVWYLYDDL